MSYVVLYHEWPNLPCGEGAKRKREPSSKIRKVLRGRTLFGTYSWCREVRSFLYYFRFVVIYYFFVVGFIVVFVFVLVFVRKYYNLFARIICCYATFGYLFSFRKYINCFGGIIYYLFSLRKYYYFCGNNMLFIIAP